MNRSLYILVLLGILLTSCTSTSDKLQTTRTVDLTTGDSVVEAENALCSEPLSISPKLPTDDVLNLAKTEAESAEAYVFAEEKNAEIIPVDNGTSFAVWWQPEDFDVNTDTVVVSLHGHGSWATKDFEVWYPQLTERKMAYLGLQWWFGRSLEEEGYYNSDQIYTLIAKELESKGIPSGHVIFQGFSMGGARSYGVSLYDKLCGEHYFGVNIANSGPWEDDYPLYAQILSGIYGEKPFENTHWILFCGETDVNEHPSTPELANVCNGMTITQTTLTELGATVDLLLKDPKGDHGSFMINSNNVNEAMDEAEAILENQKN